MTTEQGPRPAFHTVRVIRVPRGAAVLLAVPVLLALGVASVAALAIAAGVLILAPLLRGRRIRSAFSPERSPEGDTITLDPSAYRAVADPAPTGPASSTEVRRISSGPATGAPGRR